MGFLILDQCSTGIGVLWASASFRIVIEEPIGRSFMPEMATVEKTVNRSVYSGLVSDIRVICFYWSFLPFWSNCAFFM